MEVRLNILFQDCKQTELGNVDLEKMEININGKVLVDELQKNDYLKKATLVTLHELTHIEVFKSYYPKHLEEHGKEFIEAYQKNLKKHFGDNIDWVFKREVWHNEYGKTERAFQIISRMV